MGIEPAGFGGGGSGGGSSTPLLAQAGAGSPLGSVTPTAKGYLYQDTANGALYVALSTTSADWVAIGGDADTTDSGVGTSIANGVEILAKGPNSGVTIQDTAAFAGTDNGIFWTTGAADGDQVFIVYVGSTGQFTLELDASGTLTVPAATKGILPLSAILNTLTTVGSLKRAAVGTWIIGITSNPALATYCGWYLESDGAQHDEISLDFACEAGTYTIGVPQALPFTNRGIITFYLDGVTTGQTIDLYSAGTTPVWSEVTGVVIGGGQHILTLKMDTKNASSSGYYCLVGDRITLTKTA